MAYCGDSNQRGKRTILLEIPLGVLGVLALGTWRWEKPGRSAATVADLDVATHPLSSLDSA